MATRALQTVNYTTLPISSLEAYIARVNQIPMLTHEEEQALAIEAHAHSNVDAAKQLLLPHLRFVVKIARSYSGYGLALADLIQEGNLGLMKAIKRFNPEVGVRLVSFAVHWVKAEIHEFILKNWRIVKIATTKAQRKLFFNLRKTTQHLNSSLNEAQIKSVASELNVSTKDVRLMHERLYAHDEAFDAPHFDDPGEASRIPEFYLEDHRYNPALTLESKDWTDNREALLRQGLSTLDPRSQAILKRRWLDQEKATLHELAEAYNISAERVRQIEKLAMDKLKHLLTAQSS